jgi:hypothetical protein
MRQIDVDLKFDDEGEPTFYVSEDGSQMWACTDVEMADWKDTEGQQSAIEQVSKSTADAEVVILFDGSDTMIYASMSTVREG